MLRLFAGLANFTTYFKSAALRMAGSATAIIVLALVLPISGAPLAVSRAAAFTIELDDVAPMRIEWQRKFARGEQPFPGAPSIQTLDERLAERGFVKGTPLFIRMFKAESEMEIWLLRGQKYELFETYPICHWSGSIGPKLAEGDKQNPEGFYTVANRQLRHWGRWPKSIDIGFPNKYDRAHGRTGSYILLHGGCSSVGCFAMTDPAMEEIYLLAQSALRKGQNRFQIHIYPFRMSARNLGIFTKNKWYDFWKNLKEGYDNFERTRVPPRISVCGKRYLVEDAGPDEIKAPQPMRRLQMIKMGDATAGGDNCFEQGADNKKTAPKGELRHASMTKKSGKF